MNIDKYCVFRSGQNWHAVPALSVRYVTPTPRLFAVPQTHGVLAGVCHLRNEFLAVLHLGRLCGHETASALPSKLLSIASVQGAWGLLADEVRALATLDSTTGETDSSGFGNLVVGAATHEGNFVRLLDPNRLYKLAEDQLRETWDLEQSQTLLAESL